ncbi:MAG: FAD-dependent oxidoreductase [Microbacteriaceae bacterium]
MADPAARPAIVVGGGIAGLVVARTLAVAGREVTVLEASDRLGGQVMRHEVGGITLDAGAESFATRGGAVAALAAELGLGDDVVAPLDSPAWLFRLDGSSRPLPATSVLGIPGVPLARDVIDVIGFGAALRAQMDSLMPSLIGAKSETLGELVRRRMGRGVLDGLVAPITRGVHSSTPDELALDRAHPGLRGALLKEGSLADAVRLLRDRAPAGSQVAGLRGGVSRLVDALADDIRARGGVIRLGARAEDVGPGSVTTAAETLHGDVVVAAPGVVGEPPTGRRVGIVTIVVDAPALDAAPRGTGVLVAANAPGVAARALTHASAKWAWVAEAAGSRHVLRLSYDALPADPVGTAVRDASALLGMPLPHPDDAAIIEWTRAAPQKNAVEGMWFAGEAGAGTGLAAIVADSLEQAERLLHADGVDER